MTNSEMIKLLRGDRSDKIKLFDELTSRILADGQLGDNEVSIFEALKKELIPSNEGGVVLLSADIVGSSTAGG